MNHHGLRHAARQPVTVRRAHPDHFVGQVITCGISRPAARASAMASTSAGWSLPKFAKMQDTPCSTSASRKALDAVYMGSISVGGIADEALHEPLEQPDQSVAVGAKNCIYMAVVVRCMMRKPGQVRVAYGGQ